MSTIEFQKALFQISKNSNKFCDQNKNSFLQNYDLNQKEAEQLQNIIQSKFVHSFSKRGVNKRYIKNVKFIFKAITKIIGEQLVKQLYINDFENLDFQKGINPLNFKLFLQEHPKVLSLNINKTFLNQLMHYEWTKHHVFSGSIDVSWKPNVKSVLLEKHPFMISSYDYNIPEIIELLETQNWSQVSKLIKPRVCYYLVTRYEENGCEELGEFEIDLETFSFLNQQSTSPSITNPSIPDSYNDLVDLGICKKLAN